MTAPVFVDTNINDLQHDQSISGLRVLNPFHPDFQMADLPAKPTEAPRR